MHILVRYHVCDMPGLRGERYLHLNGMSSGVLGTTLALRTCPIGGKRKRGV